MSESDVLRIADKHGQRWKAPDEEGISFEKSAFFEFAEELLASRDAEVQRLRDALGQAERRLHGAAQMLEAINENDPSRDRRAAADKALDGLNEIRAALKEQQ